MPACFHCGLPVPAAGRHRAVVLGEERGFCCTGCETIARTIVQSGFERYYETRELPAGEAGGVLPQDLPPAAIYDDPLAQRQFVASTGPHRKEATLILDRIRCAACVWLNEQALRALPGVAGVTINYATRRALVSWDERAVRLSQVIEAVRQLGYDAFPYDPDKQSGMQKQERRDALWRLFVAGFGAMQVMMYAFPRYIDDQGTLSSESEQLMRWASLVLTLPVMAFACKPFFANALADLRARRAGVDTPVSAGILAAFLASVWATLSGSGEVYFDSISMLVFLLLSARYLELAARQRASAGLDRLMRWMPAFADRVDPDVRSGAAERIPVSELRVGDQVLVAPGETVPADGVALEGESSVDESLLTGESRPVPKRAGASLIGGSVNIEQPLRMRVDHVGVDTRAAAISRLIERASASRPALVDTADRIAGHLTWVVLACALLAWAGWQAFDPGRAVWVAIAILVVTCPCALALAAPIAITTTTGRLSARGIVLTRSSALQAAERISDVVLDKTGTLTQGRLSVAHGQVLGGEGMQGCLALAAALEASSRHPVAQALRARAGGLAIPKVEGSVQHFPGAGVEGRIDGRCLRLGTQAFVAGLAGPWQSGLEPSAHRTPVYLGNAEGWLACFELEDSLREGATEAVARLRAGGLRVHLLSGDAPAVVEHHARAVGVDTWMGGASPQVKHAYVLGLQQAGARVMMVGDGVNDAPVLALADVSVAMGEGAPLAQMQADFVLLNARLAAVPLLLSESVRTMRNVRQNFAWALAYNALALPAAMAGLIGPWEAAIGMAGSSFVVVLNALRLVLAAETRQATGHLLPPAVAAR